MTDILKAYDEGIEDEKQRHQQIIEFKKKLAQTIDEMYMERQARLQRFIVEEKNNDDEIVNE